MYINVNVDIDANEILDELSDELIEAYYFENICNTHKNSNQGVYDYKIMVHDYFHGDLDLVKLFQKLGRETVLKILAEM